jgi:transketolase
MKKKETLKKIRKEIIKISYQTKSAHLGSSLSCVEILFAIFEKIKKKKNYEVIFSKGHAAIAYYTILKHFNFLSERILENYLKSGSTLWSHITKKKNPYLKFNFGSLGYGLGISAGLSLGYKFLKKKHQIFCVISDGELNEGSTWESLMFISHHNIKNIIILVDNNKWQSFGQTKDILNLEPYEKKFKSFNFNAYIVDGHNLNQISKLINKRTSRPKIIICKTVKGKGLKRIEDSLESHYIPAKKEDLHKL